MNIVLGQLGLSATLGLISGVTGTTQNIYALIGRMTQSNMCDINKIIQETDLEMTIRVLECLVSEIKLDEKSPVTINICLKGIHSAVKDIEGELEKIKYRLEYNKNIWVLSSFRSFKFQNCSSRLKNYLNIIENRKKLLFEVLTVQNCLVRNSHLENALLQSWADFDKNKLENKTDNKLKLKQSGNKSGPKIELID